MFVESIVILCNIYILYIKIDINIIGKFWLILKKKDIVKL